MGMLAFFPWLSIDERIDVGSFRLTPFERGQAPAGAGTAEQRLIDGVLAPFRRAHGPVNVATIAHVEGKAYTTELDEAERNELFVFSQVVAFGGLAAREFCSYGRYCNTADFSFVIQGFRDEPNGTFFDVRRRDGYSGTRVTADAYQVQAPVQMSSHRPIHLDVALIRALMNARGTRVWDRVFEAIGPFLRANTDSADVTEQTEVVEMAGAFENALGVWGSDDLKRELGRRFRPTRDISPRNAPRIPPARRNGVSVRSLWIADFYDLRNAHAHGSQTPPADLVWDRKEHLLLGAYAFPLLVKSLLSEENVYQLTEADQKAIDLFEWRARAQGHLLERIEREGRHGDFRWNHLELDFIWEQGRQALEEYFRREAASSSSEVH